MSGRSDERSAETLRRRAERAMDEGRGRRVVEPLLERILKLAPEGDPCRVFAHRHLAELRLEEDPWAAALHLRKVIGAKPHDDVAHSLMALAQALLGNYRAAVSSYRRALTLEPRNPWYHHNLGHLLDVALDDPSAALAHLEVALAHADPPEHEITASVAHCLARVGRMGQAQELARQAAEAAPENREHRALLRWIEAGAPADVSVHGVKAETRRARTSPATDEVVVGMLEDHMRDAGFTAVQVEHARALWADYRDEREPRVKRPEILCRGGALRHRRRPRHRRHLPSVGGASLRRGPQERLEPLRRHPALPVAQAGRSPLRPLTSARAGPSGRWLPAFRMAASAAPAVRAQRASSDPRQLRPFEHSERAASEQRASSDPRHRRPVRATRGSSGRSSTASEQRPAAPPARPSDPRQLRPFEHSERAATAGTAGPSERPAAAPAVRAQRASSDPRQQAWRTRAVCACAGPRASTKPVASEHQP